MRAMIQRVSSASVKADGVETGRIGRGMVILVGFEAEDGPEDLEWTARKLLNLRIFDDDHGVMNRSVLAVNGEVLLVSQFTLHANVKKGNRPSYNRAAPPEVAIPLYESFAERLDKELPGSLQGGVFGAAMEVSLVNEGPVTIMVDSKNKDN